MLSVVKILCKLIACVVLISAAATADQQDGSAVMGQEDSLQAACKKELTTFCHTEDKATLMQGPDATACLHDHRTQLGLKCLAQLEGDRRHPGIPMWLDRLLDTAAAGDVHGIKDFFSTEKTFTLRELVDAARHERSVEDLIVAKWKHGDLLAKLPPYTDDYNESNEVGHKNKTKKVHTHNHYLRH